MVAPQFCFSCNSCFGCTSLQQKTNCILNKQYLKGEYDVLAAKIIENMKANDEWGRFFPVALSPFAYNESMAMDWFPISKEEAISQKYAWKEHDEVLNVKKVIPADRLPDSINDIPDDIVNWAIKCGKTGRPFRIVKQELDFYRKMKLPIPHLHPEERNKERLKRRHTRKLWKRKCTKCSKDIQTTYAPDCSEKVFCEECYLKEVY